MTDTPASLLQRLRNATDRDAWQRFVTLYGPIVHTWLTEFRLQYEDACDVAQEVLLAVAQAMPDFRYDKQGSFRGWLRVVVTHRVRGFWRRRDRRREITGDSQIQEHLARLEDPNSAASLRWNEDHDRKVLNRLLGLLKAEFQPTTWQAFWRVVIDGVDSTTVAKELGISRNAVQIAKSRVLRRLRQEGRGLFE